MTCLILLPAIVAVRGAGVDLPQLEEDAIATAVRRVAPATVRIELFAGDGTDLFSSGIASGLIVSPDGWVVTSESVLGQNPSAIVVMLNDGRRLAAQHVATDHSSKVSMLKLATEDPLPAIEVAPAEEIQVGQWAIALGRVFESDRVNVSVGIVSAVDRILGRAIQTDALISPNNYGGPLVDIHGRVLAVLAPLSPETADAASGTDWYDSGVGFAVPLERIMNGFSKMSAGEDVYPGILGISPKSAQPYDPVVIGASRPGSPAYLAGLRTDDEILTVNDRLIPHWVALRKAIGPVYAGDKVRIGFRRDGNELQTQAQLVAELDPFSRPFLGILPQPAVAADEGEMKPAGVTVRYVFSESPASSAGILTGDRIVGSERKDFANRDELRQFVFQHLAGDEIELKLFRHGEQEQLKIKLAGHEFSVPESLPPPPAIEQSTDEESPLPAGDRDESNPLLPDQKALVYVPEDLSPDERPALLIWFHEPGHFDRQEMLDRWKPFANEHRLLLLAPISSDEEQWEPRNIGWIAMLTRRMMIQYKVDERRVVAHGYRAGGAMAYLMAFSAPSIVSGVAVVESPIPRRAEVTEAAAEHPQDFFVANSTTGKSANRILEDVARLQELKHPTVTQNLGNDPRYLNSNELELLARWINCLDRI